MKLYSQQHGAGSPLVILHGLFGSSDNWHTLARRFAGHFHVYAVDLRNHGRSPHSAVHTYEAMADDLLEFLRSENIASASFIGHSMGGKAAMQFALTRPERVSRLIVVDIGPGEYSSRHDYILDALVSVDLKAHASRRSIDDFLARGISSPVVRQFLLKNLSRTDNGFTWKLNLGAIHTNYDAMNRAISGPPFPNAALFIRSLQSGYVSEEDRTRIFELFPGAVFADLNVGHWIHAEAPDQLYRIAVDFLRQGS